MQVLVLGTIWLTLATCSDSLYALLAGSAGRWLKGDPRLLRARRRCAGGIFIALGIGTAVSGAQSR